MNIILIYILSWLGLVVLAIVNGAIRENVYGPYMSELSAHQLSTLIVLILFSTYIFVMTGIFKIQSTNQSILIGCIWLVMTILFEFVFGHYVMGNPWQQLFNDYNILEGRVWILILLWTTVAPYTFYKIRS